ncbi:MAG: hypothetical protein DRJ05_13685 [Bacteroidetes bacterium]|nr:MAG: hypothetical protein DRJ05_13685 [Bacteroidota bacterium]
MEFLELITLPAHTISQTRATVGCEVINGVGDVQVDYGICWSTSPNPTIDSTKSYESRSRNKQGFASTLIELIPDTTYYARAYASNSGQSIYGNEITFRTDVGTIGTVADIDGNIYNTVIVGEQVWMVENLKTTKYRNGDPIPNVTSITQWLSLTTGAYCYYDNDINNGYTFGNLYNWHAVNDIRNIAPEGWHVATDSDWSILMSYWAELANNCYLSDILREEGEEHWPECQFASNESGFTALPGGKLDQNGFSSQPWVGYYWSSTEYYPGYPYYWKISCSWSVDRNNDKKTTAYSVRCVKD